MRASCFKPLALASLLAALAGSSLLAPAAFADELSSPSLPYTYGVSIGWQMPCRAVDCTTYVCPGKPYPVRVWGGFADGCGFVRRVEFLPSPVAVIGPPTMRIVLDDGRCPGKGCTQAPTTWSVDTVAWGLPAGTHTMRIEVVHVSCTDSFPPDSVRAANFPFQVTQSSWCSTADSLAYVDHVQIGQPTCTGCLPEVCANQSFVVTLSGTLPSSCVTFNGLSLVPVVYGRPGPPIVRATFGVNDCLGMPCEVVPTEWSASIELPPLPAGQNGLMVQSATVSWCDSTRLGVNGQATFPFMVRDSCPPGAMGCLNYDWAPHPDGNGECNAVFLNDTASVDLLIASPRSLAGLQGLLKVEPGLEVRGLHPIGPASGMTLEWRRTPLGAAFVMFAANGAPIPPFATVGDDTAYNFAPVLHVEMKAVPYVTTFRDPPKTVFAMRADSLLGADSLGQGVPMCLMRCLDTANNWCGMPLARFCARSECDVNFDGHTDVRDLVRLVYCLNSRGCFPPVAFDCNADSLFTILDVLCCARRMLNMYESPGTGGRPDPSIGLAFDEPVRAGDEIELPFTLAGADHVGAARMALRFPSDRYDVESFGLVGNPPGWLALHEVVGDELVVALIATDASQAVASLPLSLRLRLRPGADHGGEVIAREADVSSVDGAALLTGIVGSGAVVDPAAPIALSGVHPNPSSGPMHFSLTLPRASDVDLAVHDLAGRRVATVHRGAMAPGVYPFTWDGRTDRGETARDGVYFLRLRAGGTEIARKAVLVRER